MKRILLAVVISSCLVNFSYGQFEKPIMKGHMLLGGSLAVDFERMKEYDQTLSPQIIYYTDGVTFTTDLYCGYFILNQLALGVKTDITTSSIKEYSSVNKEKSKHSYHNAGFGPFVRYYTKQGIFVETFASLALWKTSDPNASSSWKNFSYGLGIGYSWFVNPSIAIEPQVKFVHQNQPQYLATPNEVKTDGITVSIGFQIYLNLKKKRSTD
jgi:opacity protein-like surface antigen